MITKKEDLMNTYIRNDNGELLELYIASCLEFGFHLSPAFNDSKLLDDEFMFIATGIDGDSVWAVNNRYDAMTSQITISDLKPRTKTEFVKVEYSHAWEIVKLYEDGVELFKTDSDELQIERINSIALRAQARYPFYRKVETEIDERQEFIDAVIGGNGSDGYWFNGVFVSSDVVGVIFDSGKVELVEK